MKIFKSSDIERCFGKNFEDKRTIVLEDDGLEMKVTIGFHGGWFSQENYVVNLRLENTDFGYDTSNISVGLLEKIVAEMHDYENEIQEKLKLI